MGRVDKAWLEMDRVTNLMVINGVMLFDDPIDYASLQRAFEQRMVNQFPRFRQHIVEAPAGSNRLFWEDDPYFDIRSHVLHIALPEPGDTATLQRLVSDLMSSGLDRTKPLWRIYLIDNVNGGCAIYSRFHHCIADGIALMRVMLSMTEREPAASLLPVIELPESTMPTTAGGLVSSSFRFAMRTTKRAAGLAGFVVRESAQTLRDPQHLVNTAVSTGVITAAGAAVLARLLVIPKDRSSSFRGPLGTSKRVVWSEGVDIAQVKAIGASTGSTINDVLVAAVSGALSIYMQERGDSLDSGDLRAMVPVNLRDPDAALGLGNEFGLVYLSLPVSIADPLQRLYEVKRRMDVLKRSPEAVITYQVLNLLGSLPGELASQAVELFAAKASAVLTNVPGPRQTLYFVGKPIRNLMFWVPQSGDIGMGISIISYANVVTLGLMIDELLVDDPARIMVLFQHEFDTLTALTRQLSTMPA